LSPRVSVIIPGYRSDRTIGACLAALHRQTFRDFEVIVVNSSAGDRTPAIVAGDYPDANFEQAPSRLLPHEARNRGAGKARGRILAFTDPDCAAEPDWLARLVRAHDDGHMVVVGAMGMAGSSLVQQAVHLCKFAAFLDGLRPGFRPVAPTANVSFARPAWEKLRAFSGQFFLADVEMSWRARALGYRIWFEPRAKVVHHHEHDVRSYVREFFGRGREFGRMRIEFARWSRWRALAYALLLPGLLATVLIRNGRAACSHGWAGRFVLTLPLQILFEGAWLLGEVATYGTHAARGAVA
jgi:O-antigen biosynthesis protein